MQGDGRDVQLVLELVVPDEVAFARPSRLARMESRSDDSPDTVAARLVTYRREAGPLLAHYVGRVRRVSAWRRRRGLPAGRARPGLPPAHGVRRSVDHEAAPLQQDHVLPAVAQLAQALAHPDGPEPAAPV